MKGSESRDASVPSWRVRAWPAWVRGASALLVATSRATLPIVAAAGVLGSNLPPRLAIAGLVALGVLPALAHALLARAFAADVAIDGDTLRVATSSRRIEVALANVAALVPWRVPLPGAGASVALRSGARLPLGIEPAPQELRDALAAAGVAMRSHPNWRYADAKHDRRIGWLADPLVKFGLFAVIPIAVLFRAHQLIAYGGAFGQAYLEGWRAWFATLAFYAATTLLYLVLYASLWRAFAECAAWVAAYAAPSRGAKVRRALEVACLVVYYAGVPALLALRFLA